MSFSSSYADVAKLFNEEDHLSNLVSLGSKLKALISTTDCVSHLHLSAGWKTFVNTQISQLSDDDLSKHFSSELFVDKFIDNFPLDLGTAKMWLRLRNYHNGTHQWYLKWNVRVGDEIQYDEAQGVLNILPILNHTFGWKLQTEYDLELAFPAIIAIFPCVRVKCAQWSGESFEIHYDTVKLKSNCFYSIATYDSRAKTGDHATSNANVLSKAFAYLFCLNKHYYDKHFPETSPSVEFDTDTSDWFARMFSEIENTPTMYPPRLTTRT